MKHPVAHAKELADAILGDTIAAGQIKEYISNDHLIELLGIEWPDEPEQVAAPTDIFAFTDSEIVDEAFDRDLEQAMLDKLSTNMLLCELKSRGVSIEAITDFYAK